jgi:hypothetical protein
MFSDNMKVRRIICGIIDFICMMRDCSLSDEFETVIPYYFPPPRGVRDPGFFLSLIRRDLLCLPFPTQIRTNSSEQKSCTVGSLLFRNFGWETVNFCATKRTFALS